ncbi:hypothetical protein KBC01_02405 [Candidatus Parcubacteria bacterium]|nr:hypothetical protein [Candidatus Parcubacteria bacterium]
MRKKKIFDIVPPNERCDINSFHQEESFNFFSDKKLFKKEKRFKGNNPNSFSNIFFISIGLIILLLASSYFLIDPKLDLKIKPAIAKFQVSARALSAEKQNDQSALFVPLQELKIQKSLSQEVPVSKKDGSQKARGVITLYNEYSNTPETFVEGTRFVDADGKIFITLQKATVPGKKANGNPGIVDIKVEAAETGLDYNIGPSTFSIPKLRSTPYYTKFYGKSDKAMEGGSDGQIFSLTQDDIDAAKKILEDKAYEQAKDIILAQYPDYEILSDSIGYDVIYPDYSKEIGKQIDVFNCQGDVKIRSLGIRKSDLRDFAMNYIKSNISRQKKIIEKTLAISLSANNVNIEDRTARLVIEISIDSYFDIDFDDLKKSIMGSREKDLKGFLFDKYGEKIQEVKFKLTPFWRGDLPKNQQNITIGLEGVD